MGEERQLPEEISNFKPAEVGPPRGVSMNEWEWIASLNTTELMEVKQRLSLRLWVATFFLVLLFMQNAAVFFVVIYALLHGSLNQIGIILGVLVSGTLAQTYLITRTIVGHLYEKPHSKKHEA